MTVPAQVPNRATEFSSRLSFPLDPFQIDALEAVEMGESVLVAAPTGAGKTVVAEFACWLALQERGKCFYTTPLKALSNQKFGDLIAAHGARNVGLLTGDNTINGEAPIVVMTTEVLRNMLYEGSPTLQGLRWVVLDEVHYLQDPYRGAVWEEVLIHLPPDVRVVCLSATVSNLEEFGGWLGDLRGTTRVVVETQRPVELRNLVLVGAELLPLMATDEQDLTPRRGYGRGGQGVNPSVTKLWSRGEANAARYGHTAPRKRRPGERVYTPNHVEVTLTLDEAGMLPAICFIFSRVGCDRAVEACLYAGVKLTDAGEEERIREFAELRSADLDPDDLRALGFRNFLEGLARGVSSHHAGMLPVFKETVEELFAAGLVKMVFATETLSLGINMPARTVVIERLSKFTGERHELLTPLDYTQLTGRAGRRGIDELGYAVVLYSPWVPIDRIASLATRKDYELSSSFRPSYNMAVNLVPNYTEDKAYQLLNSSFAQYVVDREIVRWERRLQLKEREVEQARERASCELGDVMEYAALKSKAQETVKSQRGSEDVRKAFVRLVPGDVIWAGGLGKALVCEQPRTKGGGEPQLTVVTADRKLRRLTPRDFRTPPHAQTRLPVKGQGWRSPKIRRQLTKELASLDLTRPERPPPAAAVRAAITQAERHPVAACPDAEEHLEWAARLQKSEQDAASLKRRVRRRKGTLARTFERVMNVLRTLGYVEDWRLTPKGELLRNVYNENDLLVVECLTRGWLNGLDAEELAAVVSMFVYEARGRDESESAPNPHLSRYQRRIGTLAKSLAETEAGQGLELLSEPDAGFMSAMYEWASGASLETVLEDRQMSAGDFVRWAKQVVDLLKQLKQIAPPGELADTLAEAVKAVQRGVVAYSSVI